jgi:hypothetical protein
MTKITNHDYFKQCKKYLNSSCDSLFGRKEGRFSISPERARSEICSVKFF